MELLPIYLLAGAAAGVLAGLFGAGGGIVTVPVLHLVFLHHGINDSYSMHLAIGTSMGFMIVNSCFAVLFHHRKRNVDWALFRRMALMVLLGTISGALIASLLNGLILRYLFSGFTLCAATYVFASLYGLSGVSLELRIVPYWFSQWFAFFVGTFSAILGVGGSIINVPYFLWRRLPIRKAVGTAAAFTPVIALFGSLVYIYAGCKVQSQLPAHSLGYIYLPALLSLLSAGIACSFVGVKLAHRIPAHVLRASYGCLLLFLSYKML